MTDGILAGGQQSHKLPGALTKPWPEKSYMQGQNGMGYASKAVSRIFESQPYMLEAKTKDNVMQEFDTEFLLNAPEIYIFSACRHIVEQVLAARGALNTGEMDTSRYGVRLTPLLAQLRGLGAATQRFDIVLPLISETAFSPFFWRWYNWWFDYRQSLTSEDLDRVHRLQDAFDPAALEYRPPGHWLGHRATPPLDSKCLRPSLNASRASSARASE